MDKTIKQDDQIMKLLNVSTINRIICNTDKGMLTLQIRKGDKNYHLILDSVPLDKEVNKELMQILFPVKEVEIPQVNMTTRPEILYQVEDKARRENTFKPKGRPKGSKNK